MKFRYEETTSGPRHDETHTCTVFSKMILIAVPWNQHELTSGLVNNGSGDVQYGDAMQAKRKVEAKEAAAHSAYEELKAKHT